MLRTATLCFLLLIPVHSSARAKDLTVNLKFVPQEGVHSESPDIAPSMLERAFELRVEDSRAASDAMRIGKGTDDDDEVFSIASGSDVVSYVKDTLAALSGDWGLKIAAPTDRVLTVKVARFFVDESNKAVGSMYASEVKLAWTLADAKGRQLAEGTGSGSAHRYGRARSADNCSEVLSDALKEAYAAVLSSHSLQTAWISGEAAAGAAPAPQEKGSVEERLRKLDDLLKKGLITKDEYAKKRAEILKDV
ncbi:MAG TPA: SHOCT domain-containing protein [Thermoanaerobaculia bacterium]|nr:SHOCT domain-containing protein [Thermoanaerobaculia bacterium]